MGGIWQGLLDIIFQALLFFYNIVHDWGWAIILLTIAFRVVLIPLTWKQTKSMYELQQIQPKIKALQEKYKDNKEKQQEELMKFYSENKVNPFGGCLPMILQMPLFIALFSVLRDNLPVYIEKTFPVAQQAAEKAWWFIIPDITMSPQAVYTTVASTPTATVGASVVATTTVVPQGSVPAAVFAVIPYIVLVILFGLSVWAPQFLMSKDPTQRKTATYMAIVMLWFGFVSPAGVLLYWVTSSGWQIGQQVITQRSMNKAKEAQEAADAAAAVQAKADKAAQRALRSKENAEKKNQGKGTSS